jgi:hypothetical protein
MKVKIKEQSWCARLAARKMRSSAVAMVLGRTIHLWNISRDEFLKRPTLVVHEMEHVRQFHHYGFLRFCALYLWESVRKGYYNNRFEVEARRAERGMLQWEGVEFV